MPLQIGDTHLSDEQGQMLVQILAESRDHFCDVRSEYPDIADDPNDDVRNKMYDDYETLERTIAEQVNGTHPDQDVEPAPFLPTDHPDYDEAQRQEQEKA